MADWYVSQTQGSNSTGNGSSSNPWQTIGYAIGRSTTVTGDTIWVGSGTYRETVNGKSGVSIKAILGQTPIISACDALTSWTLVDSTKNIWATNQMNWTMNNASNQQPAGNDLIFLNGEALPEARWPHLPSNKKFWSLHRSDWAQATSGSDTGGNLIPNNQIVSGTFSCNQLTELAGIDITGARITFITGSQWAAISGTVTSVDCTNKTVTFSFPNRQLNDYRLTNGGHFFLFDHYDLLGENEWFRNSSTGTLYLRLPSGQSPTGQQIEAKRRARAIELWDISNVSIEGFTIRGGNVNTSTNSHNIKFINCRFLHPRHRIFYQTWWEYEGFGIILQGNNCELNGCTISRSSSSAVGLLGNNALVSQCTIEDVGYAGGDAAHLNCENGGGHTIRNNSFTGNGASNSIRFARNASGLLVENNQFGRTGRLVTDAGIVMIVKNTNPTSAIQIKNNYIFDALGARDQSKGLYGVSGLYTEGNISNVEFSGNIITNCYVAVGLVPIVGATNLNIKVYHNSSDGRLFFHPSSAGYNYTGSEIINNLFTRLNLTSHRTDLVLRNNAFTEVAPANNLHTPNPLLNTNWAPAAGSPLIDAGEALTSFSYKGTPPRIGAK